MKQPRVPEYREGDGVGAYLRMLILFLRDFCQEVWTACRQSDSEIKALGEAGLSTDIALRHAGSDAKDSAVRRCGAFVYAQIHIGISRYPQSGDDGYVIGMIPEEFRPRSSVRAAGVLEQGGVPKSIALITIDTTGEIRAAVGDTSHTIDAENGAEVTADVTYCSA